MHARASGRARIDAIPPPRSAKNRETGKKIATRSFQAVLALDGDQASRLRWRRSWVVVI